METKLKSQALQQSGWEQIQATLTYSSADDPTYVVSTSIDLTGIISVGMRIKFTNNSTTFYGIVTAIDASTMTLYGGTDYDVANSAITSPYFSTHKAPLGFPLDPTKWTVRVANSSQQLQSSPTAGTYYNIGSLSIDVPIGSWNLRWEAATRAAKVSTAVNSFAALSTSSSSVSDSDLEIFKSSDGASATRTTDSTEGRKKLITLSSKTTYYFILKTSTTSASDLRVRGDVVTTVFEAICAYL